MPALPEFDHPHYEAELTISGYENNVAGLMDELGRFAAASKYVVGIAVQSRANTDQTAFTGGHTVEHREDHAALTLMLNTDEGIRHATRLLIPEERLAEIADAYVLPEHLKNPANHVDAFIGHTIKRLVGYEENTDRSIAQQAVESTTTLMAIPGITPDQALAFSMSAEDYIADAQMNMLHRPTQVETMEHVLRFLIARENAKRHTKGNVYAGVDYDWATGILGEALAIVNGTNGFNEDEDPHTNDYLYRGLLEQKSSLAIEDKVVYFSGINGPEPIWPPEKVEAHHAELRSKAEAKAEAAEAKQREWIERKRAAQEAADAAFMQGQAHLHETMRNLKSEGYEWHGILRPGPNSPMSSIENVRAYYAEKYNVSPDDIHVVEGAAIYNEGKDPHVDAQSITVYVRKQKN